MKYIFGALAAAAIVGVTFIQPAEARCFWNGFATVCTHGYGYGYGYRHGYPYRHFYGGGYERPYWWGGY